VVIAGVVITCAEQTPLVVSGSSAIIAEQRIHWWPRILYV